MPRTLADLAHLVQGTLIGDGQVSITGTAPLGLAAASDITLIDSPDKLRKLESSQAAAAIVPRSVAAASRPIIQVDDVHEAFVKIVLHFHPQPEQVRSGVSAHAHVSPTAQLGRDVEIHAGVTIGDHVQIGDGATIHSGVHILAGCRIAENVTIFPNAVLYENSIVGARTIIHAASVIGAYGFGYKFVDGRHVLTAQLGYVEVRPDVEVGAGTTIDRGTYGPTIIGEGTKIDDQVMIGHNCRLGRHNMICSQVGIAGSTTTGDYVVMAGQVGVRDHVHIGDKAVLGAKAGIAADVPDGETMLGVPAQPVREQKLIYHAYAKLPEMRHKIRDLERTVAELTRRLDDRSAAA